MHMALGSIPSTRNKNSTPVNVEDTAELGKQEIEKSTHDPYS
jgi:hypothetical protein